MREIRLEHGFADYELVEVLEKGLGAAQDELSHPERFSDPNMQVLARKWRKIWDEQVDHMVERIAQVLQEPGAP